MEWRDTFLLLFLTCTALSAGFVLLGAAALGRRPYAWRRFAVAGVLGVAAIVILFLTDERRNVSSLLPIAGVLLALLAIGWWCWTMFILGRSRGRRRCPKCWYDMSATEGLRCPECGRTAKRERHLFRTRRHKRLIILTVVPALLGIYLALLPRVQQHGWQAALPTTALVWCLELENNDWAFQELARRASSVSIPGVQIPMPSDGVFFDWQWRRIGRRSMDIAASDAPLANRYAMFGWLTAARSRLADDALVEEIDDVFIRLLDDPAPQIRGRAALSVAFGDDPEAALERLRPMLRDEDPRARRGAVMGLRYLAKLSDAAVELAATALDDSDGSVRSVALGVIGSAAEYREVPADILERVRQMASDDDASVRHHQVLSMVRLLDDDAARAELSHALESGDSDRRGGAIWALSMDDRFEQADFVEELIAALTDADPMVREQAASALGYYVNFADLIPFEAQLKAAFDPNLYPETASYLRHRLAEFHQRDVARELEAIEGDDNAGGV